jgi:hypothetical protein
MKTMKIINKITGQTIDNGLDDFNAGILINEYQNDDYIIVAEFNNHCTEQLSNEAKRIISTKTWHSTYKDQLLSRVEDMLEIGNWISTNTGGKSIPFKISDVDSIVTIVSDRDE